MTYSMKQLSIEVSLNVETIRFYEKKGLLSDITRTENDYRIFNISHVKQLNFIKVCKEMGFTLAEIKDFFDSGAYGDIMQFKQEAETLEEESEVAIKSTIIKKIECIKLEKKKLNHKIDLLSGFLNRLEK